jgi:hypothetical protein
LHIQPVEIVEDGQPHSFTLIGLVMDMFMEQLVKDIPISLVLDIHLRVQNMISTSHFLVLDNSTTKEAVGYLLEIIRISVRIIKMVLIEDGILMLDS